MATKTFSISFKNKKNFDNYSEILFKNLEKYEEIPKNIRKKIFICAVELIQNAIIHNDSKIDTFRFSLNSFNANFSIKQKMSKNKFEKLQGLITKINDTSLENLKIEYQENLLKEIGGSVGNGLILCRLKSENCFYLINEGEIDNKYKNIDSEQEFMTKILLEFKHGNND
ncbi:MAG: DUF6272 family protein [Bacteroidales bacterium]|jgi:hypothetical protein|nr:DUF6272 family protein [Bacteroidales bacterium]